MRVWTQSHGAGPSLFSVAEVIEALGGGAPAVVAVHQGVPIGAALACVAGERAWVMRIAIASAWRGRGLASALLVELERRLVAARVARIAYVLPEEDLLGEGLLNAGYTRQPAVAYFEKVEPLHGPAADLLDDLGGRFLPSDLWAKVAGMEHEKDLIERRVVLPLAEPERAARHGVAAAARGRPVRPAGHRQDHLRPGHRLPARLAVRRTAALPARRRGQPGGRAARRLRPDRRAGAGARLHRRGRGDRPGAHEPAQPGGIHGVTNELLKLIPGFREGDERLLVCATNSIRSLDPAFLRPGRFDYLIPIGTPDAGAGGSIWSRFITAVRADRSRSTTWSRSPSCSPRPTSSSPRARPPNRPSSGRSPPAPTRPPSSTTSARPSPRPGRR